MKRKMASLVSIVQFGAAGIGVYLWLVRPHDTGGLLLWIVIGLFIVNGIMFLRMRKRGGSGK